MLYGVNYGNHLSTNTFDKAAAFADLDELKASGITAIRIAVPGFDQNTVSLVKQVALAAKNRNFIVTFGVGTGSPGNSLTRWNTYLAWLPLYAAWAQQNFMDYFSIGNEEELHVDGTTLTAAQVRSDIKSITIALKSRFPNLKFAYATDQSNISNWADPGTLDQIGFNVYGSLSTFQNAVDSLKTNPKAIVTEWSTSNGINDTSGDMAAWTISLVARRNYLNNSGVQHYLFVVRGNGFGIDDKWSMWVGSNRRAAWAALYGG